MTICKGTSPEDGRETIVIVLEHVTGEQFEALRNQLEKAFETMSHDPDTIVEHAMFNLLCDLEVGGYEMS